MLKYIILICTISFCYSNVKLPDTYTELIFSQRFPTTNDFYNYGNIIMLKEKYKRYIKYIVEHIEIYKGQKWVINGLWSSNSSWRLLNRCTDSEGNLLKLNRDLVAPFMEELKAKWPPAEGWSLVGSLGVDYLEFGSCVTANTTFYIEKSLQLFEKYYVDTIFKNVIIPDKQYNLNEIVDYVTSKLGKQGNVKCLQPSNTDKQYLLEIEICFDKNNRLKDCTYQRDLCISNKTVYYPIIPEDYIFNFN